MRLAFARIVRRFLWRHAGPPGKGECNFVFWRPFTKARSLSLPDLSDMISSLPEVVITGIGAVSPIGIGYEAVERSLASGTSGVRALEIFDSEEFPSSTSIPSST